MKRRLFAMVVPLIAFLSSASNIRADFVFTPVVPPGAVQSVAYDVAGGTVVGYFNDGAAWSGFLYDGLTYTTVDYPGATETRLFGTDGSTHVGYATVAGSPIGFSFDGSSFTTISAGSGFTIPRGIDNNNGTIVGYYGDHPDFLGFSYDGSIYQTFGYAGAYLTEAMDVDGSSIVGRFYNEPDIVMYGFIYDGSDWTILSHPNAGSGIGQGTTPMGIFGDTIVGVYADSSGLAHGFLYDGITWTDINHPDAGTASGQGTVITGYDGTTLVGGYIDSSGTEHGFSTMVIPEPGTAMLVVLGIGLVWMQRRRVRA